jgi:hypothetical protein
VISTANQRHWPQAKIKNYKTIFFDCRIIGQGILILLAYNMDWAKEWYLLTLVPTTLIGKKV